MEKNEVRIDSKENKPSNYDQAMEYEVASCAFLKEVVQGNKLMKRVKDAAEGIFYLFFQEYFKTRAESLMATETFRN